MSCDVYLQIWYHTYWSNITIDSYKKDFIFIGKSAIKTVFIFYFLNKLIKNGIFCKEIKLLDLIII